MIKSIGSHVMAAAVGVGGFAVAPAEASAFAASYTCAVPVLGSRPVMIRGTLTATSGRAVVGRPVQFQLHIDSLSLQTPVTIDSWTATAGVDVSGAQNSAFRMAGSGGPVNPRRPISGDLYGTWTPRVPGVDRFRGGDVTLGARIARVGMLSASCRPNTPRPVLETLPVQGPLRYARPGTDV
jgi:hypothetical protein